MANLALTLRESADEIASLWCDPSADLESTQDLDVGALDDASLLDSVARLQHHITLAQSLAATLAGEIQARSSRDLGHSGLAARNGFSSPEKLIQKITRSTKAEAIALTQAGRLMRDAALGPIALPIVTGELDDAGCPVPVIDDEGLPVIELVEMNPTPWLVPVARAVAAGELSAASAAAIRRGLGDLADEASRSDAGSGEAAGQSSRVSVADLLAAAQKLVELADRLDADQLFKRARQLRDEVDAEGVAERERRLHDGRYLRIWQRPDGAVVGSFAYGPEDGALLLAAANAAMSPRRGGPRFVDPEARAAARALVDDPRTNDQLQADAFMAAIRLAVDADPNRNFGHNRPAVKVIVFKDAVDPEGVAETPGALELPGTREPADAVENEGTPAAAGSSVRKGFGRIEGTHEAVSLGTIERHLCDSGAVGMSFTGDGKALDLGRESRLFSRKQREVMAVRDGRCIGSDDCAVPPAMCEAHHLDPWSENGRTDVDDGVLLCRFHHLNFHNNGYRIVRKGGVYWLIPPPEVDPQQVPVRLYSNNPDFAARATG
ncbi:MAG: DUF222 domain-containing protein [Rhodoglobus sp.]